MRCAADVNGLQTLKAANAVLYMHYMVTGCQTARLSQKVFRFLTAGASHHAIAENILLGQYAQFFSGKSVIHGDYGDARALPLLRRLPCVNALHRWRTMFLQKRFQSLHCTMAGDDQKHRTTGSLFCHYMGDHCVK